MDAKLLGLKKMCKPEIYIHNNIFDRNGWFKTNGEVLSIILNSNRKSMSIATIGAHILPYSRLSQIKVIYGYNEYPAAYFTWAYLTDEKLAFVQENPHAMLDIDDLNAGENVVFFDMLSNLKSVGLIVTEIKKIVAGRAEFFAIRYSLSDKKLVIRRYKVTKALSSR